MKKAVVTLIFGVIFIVFLVLGVHYLASARSSGISGYSTSGCAPCHASSASATVTVSINGPTTVGVEETNTYTISVTGGPSEAFGFDLSVTGGTLIVTDSVNTQLKDSDLTNTASGIFQSSWSFDWKATSSPGTVTMNVATLSANGDGKSTSDDLWNLASLSITVESPAEIHDVAITSVTPSATEVVAGQPVDIEVTSENQGTETETFDVTALRDSTEIGKETVTLNSGQTTTVTFEWDTTGVAEGSYTISAKASILEGETDTADNFLSDGTLNVVVPPVASFTFSPSTPSVNETVSFDASSSTPDGGTIDSYNWDFGDGTSGFGVTVTHAYSSAGEYTVTLVVEDSNELTDSEEKTVTVGVAVVHDIAIKDVTVVPNLIMASESVDISVTLENQGTESENFDINVYANGDLIETRVNIVLASGSITTESFIWDTTGVADGVYAISAQVPEIEGETDIDDNSFVDGAVKVTSVLSLTLDVDPDTLNTRSHGRWITAYIELPEGYNVSDIDLSSVLLNGSISAEFKPSEVGDHDNDGTLDLMAKFDRGALLELIENVTGDRIILNVSCQVSGTLFEGYDSIRKISHG